MKNLIILIIIILTIGCGNPPIFLDSNGVTVKCNTDAVIGDKLELNGETYTVVDRETLKDMFEDEQDVSYVVTSKITDMSNMLVGTSRYKLVNGRPSGEIESLQVNGDISSWDVSNVTDMSRMFYDSQFNGNISSWDSNVTDMDDMFNNSQFNGDISNWDVSNVERMNKMFKGSQFNGDISNWDVSKVKKMEEIFRESKFNGDISNWDVSSVTDMDFIFNDSQFNGDISNWDVSNVERMYQMFKGSQFNGDISKWDVSNVTNMTGMFSGSNFNGDISKWDVSNVTYMGDMFYKSNFNGDISNWDVSNVESMDNMFKKSLFTYTPSLINWKLPNLKSAGGGVFSDEGDFLNLKNMEYSVKFFKEIGWIDVEELNKELYNFSEEKEILKYRDDLNKLLNNYDSDRNINICTCLRAKGEMTGGCNRQFLITYGDSEPTVSQMRGYYDWCRWNGY